jgi:hypothetical protein
MRVQTFPYACGPHEKSDACGVGWVTESGLMLVEHVDQGLHSLFLAYHFVLELLYEQFGEVSRVLQV